MFRTEPERFFRDFSSRGKSAASHRVRVRACRLLRRQHPSANLSEYRQRSVDDGRSVRAAASVARTPPMALRFAVTLRERGQCREQRGQQKSRQSHRHITLGKHDTLLSILALAAGHSMQSATTIEITFADRTGGRREVQWRGDRTLPHFIANTSAPLLHIARCGQSRCASPTWGIGERAGRDSGNEEVSWSSDREVHAAFIGPGLSCPARSAGLRCSLRNGASISTTAASAICGPVTPAATSSRARSAIPSRAQAA